MKKPMVVFMALVCTIVFSYSSAAFAQENINKSKFRQLYQELPTPNEYRTASGAPGPKYWQQRADYDMQVELDDERQRLYGTETITYHNNSPDSLSYLWLQLDQNVRAKDSDSYKTATSSIAEQMDFTALKDFYHDFDGGFRIEQVKDANGADLHYVIVKTMMRVDLPQTLAPSDSYSFQVKWWYPINDRVTVGGRSGLEYFSEDGNYLYAIAQFFPRMAVYDDVEGWQHKQFLGSGEFALPFGDYQVSITAPADHVVGATGLLQNPREVLTAKQRSLLQQAATADKPVLIVPEEEAIAHEKTHSTAQKTWTFKAENVRDFAFASSRKFIWDAMGVKLGERTIMAMSYYSKEGNPLWEQYSTEAVAHALRVYSKFTFDYPYPKAISVNSTAGGGMEYPMISFNGGRPEPDGTYTQERKHSTIMVIIHEVGHNFFPMIVNSDERQWTWMDEGLNTFVQYLAEQEWDRAYPSSRGPAYLIADYMKGDKRNLSPIMTNSESVHQLGPNAYSKTAAGLNILRETILGRELFDYAFKEYSRRWMFKHPTPADLFRTMEDASGVDLDWFWRGWFYTTDHVDLAIDNVQWYKIDTRNPEEKRIGVQLNEAQKRKYISDQRNKRDVVQTALEKNAALKDFYDEYDPEKVTAFDREEYGKYLATLSAEEKELIAANHNYYEIAFESIGGMVMPLIVEFEYEDGTKEVRRIPAEIWRYDDRKVSKVFVTEKKVTNITLDPFLETADVEVSNNFWQVLGAPKYFLVDKAETVIPENAMQRAQKDRESNGK